MVCCEIVASHSLQKGPHQEKQIKKAVDKSWKHNKLDYFQAGCQRCALRTACFHSFHHPDEGTGKRDPTETIALSLHYAQSG